MASGPELRVFLAGRVAVEANGHVIDETRFPGRQGRLVFAYLVAARGRAVPRDELAEALWEGTPPATWEKALSVVVSKLRAVFADNGLETTAALTGAHGCYRLELPDSASVDVVAAATAVRLAEQALASGDTAEAGKEATDAAAIAEQSFLPGNDGTWVAEQRRDLADVRTRALGVLADACLQSGHPEEAAARAEQLVALEPFRETGYRRLMEAHAAAGNRAEALRVYERCRRLLADELGAYPSPETEAIYLALLERPPRPPAATTTAPAVVDRHRGWRRRKGVLLLAVTLLVAAAIGAGFALTGRGTSTPTVVPNSVVLLDPHTLKVRRVVPVVDAPDLVVSSGGFLWITSHVLRDVNSGALRNGGDRALTRVDPSTGKALVVGDGLAPCGLTADPSGDVWVANCYPAGTGPHDDVVRIDARTLQFKKTLPLSGGEGFYRGLTYGDGSLWATQIKGGDVPNPSAVTRADPQTRTEHSIPLASDAGGLAWSGGYGDVWIANFRSATLTRLHPATGAMTTISGVGTGPAFPIVDGGVVWLADWLAPRLVRVNGTGAPTPQVVSLPVRAPGVGVWSVAAGAGAVWATTPRAHALWRIDPKTNATRRVRMPFLPSGVTVDANGVWVTVRKR